MECYAIPESLTILVLCPNKYFRGIEVIETVPKKMSNSL